MAGVRARAASAIPRVTQFTGLNNVADPLELGLAGQVVADDVIIDRRHHLLRAPGYVSRAQFTKVCGAYATRDTRRLYVIDDGDLKQINDDLSTTTLTTGLTTGRYAFDEVNGVAFFTDGATFGAVGPDGFKPWGIPAPAGLSAELVNGGTLPPGTYQFTATFTRDDGLESSNAPVVIVEVAQGQRVLLSDIDQAADYVTTVYATQANGATFYAAAATSSTSLIYDAQFPLGDELPFQHLDEPRGRLPTFFDGSLHTAEYFPNLDASVVWRSLPLQFHHYDHASEGLTVPGEVRFLRAAREVRPSGNGQTQPFLIIGTDREIYSWDGESPKLLAAYGVPHGDSAQEHEGHLYFWTLRGLARCLPFTNLTESTLSVPPGTSAAAAIIEQHGTTRYVVALHRGGTAFNPYR